MIAKQARLEGEAADQDLVASGRTAMHRARPSAMVRRLIEGDVLGDTPVFDWGCGHGQDLEYLQELGLDAAGWDPNFKPSPTPKDYPAGAYPVVLCSFVLNTLPTTVARAQVLREIREFLPSCGRVVVVVRPQEEIDRLRKPTWRQSGDGWITTRSTFQKGFTLEELNKVVEAAGFTTTPYSEIPCCVVGLKEP